ncbi:MAG: acyl carrier protein [Pirellula sp.]
MPVEEIRVRVKKTIAKVCGLKVDQIGDQDTFDALEIDSLARIEMLVELEREFKLSIPDEEEDANMMKEFQSIDNAVAMVQKNLATAAA